MTANMPKTKRGHHKTKASAKPKNVFMRAGFKKMRFIPNKRLVEVGVMTVPINKLILP